MNKYIDLLTVPEFAGTLRVKKSCVRRWLYERKLTCVHVGRLVRIPASEIERIVSAGTRPAKVQQKTKAIKGSD